MTGPGWAVTGGSGFIGGALLRHLSSLEGGRALFRGQSEKSRAWAERGCKPVYGDLDDAAALARLVRGARTVYHCAAVMARSNAGLSQRVNVGGTTNLLDAASRAGVERFVYISSISVFSATSQANSTISEGMEPENVCRLNVYARTKYQGELAVRGRAVEGGLAFTIVRPTNVYGPGSRPWFAQFDRMLHRMPVAIGEIPIDLVYVDDVVEGVVRAAASPAGANEVFHLGHEMVNMNRVILEIAKATGQRAWRLPPSADRLVRQAIDRGYRAMTGKRMSLSLVQATFYPHDKASQTLGYSPAIGLRDGFARIAAWHEAGRPP